MSTLKSQRRSMFVKLCFAICLLTASATTASAATYTVTSTADSGAGSLRQAILDANASASDDTIHFDVTVFASPQTILLGGTELTIANNGSLTINGPGANKLTISGNNTSRVFSIGSGANVAINGMTVTGGNGVGGSSSGSGGGIFNRGAMTLTGSTVSSNSAVHGAGIFGWGPITVINSTISDNYATNTGGGILSSGQMTMTNSTVVGNQAGYYGGGLYNNYEGTLTVASSTLSANSTVSGFGGGIYNNATMTLTDSIIANSINGGDCGNNPGGIVNASYSLIEDGGCDIMNAGVGNLTGDPMLGPLQYNGGSTRTQTLLPGSPAIDAGSNLLNLLTDQRGFARTIDDPNIVNAAGSDGTDIGAVESNYITVNTTAQDDDGACQPLSDGDCTLREAILAANAAPGTETIIFDIPTTDPGYDSGADRYTITLTSALPDLDSDMSIIGLGADRLTVRRGGGGAFRILHINSGSNASILGLTISGGLATEGGGIRNDGSLSIVGSHIKDNQTTSNNQYPLCASYNPNAGGGGGIVNRGYLLIDSSSFSGNRTGNGAPGFSHPDSECWVTGGNGGDGGAISNPGGTLIIRNSTFSGNGTGNGGPDEGGGNFGGDGGNGGAIYNGGSLSVSNTTINANQLGNNARGAVFNASNVPGSFILTSSIVANTDGLQDIVGIVSGDSNLVEDGFVSGGENIIGLDPKLGPLADNGGPTATHALLCGSPAIDAGKNVSGLTTDQRGFGFARTFNDPAITDATDGDGTDIGSVELQQPLVCNTAPVANDDSYSTDEDTTLNVDAPGVFGNDTDGENDNLTAVLEIGPSNGSLTLNANGSFSYQPDPNFNGTDSFTYKTKDGSLDSNVATVTITVNPVNDAPVISLTPSSQSVQYSDAIQTVRISGSDVDTPTGDLSVSFRYVRNGGSPLNNLPTGLFRQGFAGQWEVFGNPTVSAGTYVITATVSDGDRSATDTFTIVVTRENATVTPSATNPASVKVNTPGGTAGPITLCADIADAADGSLGNIALAVPVTFKLTPVAPGSSLELQTTSLTGGTACVTFNSVPVNVYDVAIAVGGDYYTGAGSSVLAVFDPTLGFTTGGGKVHNPSTGNLLHFGFSFKYEKKGFKGQMLVMEHLADGSVVKLKSNSLTSLSIVGKQAIVLGKANIADVGGNLNFRLNVTDNGEPGSSDLFGLETTTSGGAPIDAFWIDPPSTILSGNIQVPQGAKKR